MEPKLTAIEIILDELRLFEENADTDDDEYDGLDMAGAVEFFAHECVKRINSQTNCA